MSKTATNASSVRCIEYGGFTMRKFNLRWYTRLTLHDWFVFGKRLLIYPFSHRVRQDHTISELLAMLAVRPYRNCRFVRMYYINLHSENDSDVFRLEDFIHEHLTRQPDYGTIEEA